MEARITELEIKLALQDDLLDTLNNIVAAQQQQIDRLQLDLRALANHVRNMEGPGPAGQSKPEDEIPPHY
ncbi:SlyX protein [Andreprevotia lacus DSM 23236]|jgi:SlyX protein|uniref:SlyX protein n=1 Tax=Andreprevotia lacus DSM 23236 TaxID=1121001 RepID=A0A1W1Y0Q3_9NEIS|nr:SlyX family protein [Andreprevotia lacus]SMC29338.1 SlyX protein [Andreprevotia lacus DSM 23236]